MDLALLLGREDTIRKSLSEMDNFFFSEMGNQHLFHSQTCKKNNRFVGFYQIPFKLLVKNESTQLAAFYFYCANRQGPLSRIKFFINWEQNVHWQIVPILALRSSAEILIIWKQMDFCLNTFLA